MGDAFEVFRLKARQYLGPILRNRKKLAKAVALLSLFALFVVPFGFEFVQPRTGFPVFMDSESSAAVLSIFLAFFFAQGLGGGILAHPSEVDFVLTTPIRPRRYLVAEYGFQLLMFHIFLVPFLAGFSAGIGLSTGEPMRGLLVLATAELFLLLPGLIAQSIGVLASTDHRWVARAIALSAALVLLLPALHFLVPTFPLRYNDFFGPPELAATLVFGIARDGIVDGVALLGLLAYVGVAAGAWVALSGREFFPGVRPLMVMSFGQPMDFSQIARLAAERKARRTRLPVDVFRSKLPKAMTNLQLAKWTRSGALPAAIAMLFLFGFMGLVFAPRTPGSGPLAAFAFSFIPILLPSLLAVPTFTSERDRLWAYAIIPGGMSRFFQALFVSQIAVAIPLVVVAPAVVMVLTDSFSASALLALAGAAFGSAWAATLFLTKMDVPLQTFSLRPLLFVGACGLGSLPFSVPAILAGPLVANDFLGSVGVTLAYAVGLLFAGRLAHRWIGGAADSFVLDPAERGTPATVPVSAKRKDVERAYSLLAKATFGMILFALPSLLVASQPLWYRNTGPPPPMSPLEAAITAVLSGGVLLLPLLIVILLFLGYRRLVHRAMAFLSPEAQESARIARRWFLTFWGLIGISIPVFFASIGATALGAAEFLQLSVYLVFTILPSALLIALVLFLAYSAWAPLPNLRRTVLRRLVWADVLLISAGAAGTAALTAFDWHDIVTSGVLAPAYSPWTTIPSGAFNVGTLVALYFAFRWVRRHLPVRQEPGTALPPDFPTAGIR